MRSIIKCSSIVCIILAGLALLTSCSHTKNLAYFADTNDSIPKLPVEGIKYAPPLIDVDDIVNINIRTLDGNVIDAQNTAMQTTTAGATNKVMGGITPGIAGAPGTISGFLVDSKGEVEIPIIGRLKLANLTTSQARDLIQKAAEKYFENPTVSVRIENFKISVLGEVTRPASYTVPSEKISILDAISMAGDLSIYGKRDNILLIRDDSTGNKTFVRMNLNSKDIFKSPYFYLHQNDVVYVQPNKYKAMSSNTQTTRIISITSIAVSLLAIILSRIH